MNQDRGRGPTSEVAGLRPLSSFVLLTRTRSLVEESGNRLAFRPRLAVHLLGWGLLVLGLAGVASLGYLAALAFEAPSVTDAALVGVAVIAGLPIALFGSGFGVFCLRRARIRRVFDLGAGVFYCGPGDPDAAGEALVPLDEVRELQILSHEIGAGSGRRTVSELNLVLEGGSRVHVVAHGEGDLLAADARRVAERIDRPLRDDRGP